MILGLDHLVIAVADPDAAITALASFLRLSPGESGGRHPMWGTRNRLLWLGDTFIELCTVTDPQLAEGSWLGRATLRAAPEGAKAICWAISTDDLDLDRAQMNADGAALGAPLSGERRRPDGRIVRWRLALPPEVDLERPFLIEHDMAAAEWTPDDRAGRATTPARLIELSLPVDAFEGLHVDGAEWSQPVHATTLGEQNVQAVGPGAGQTTVRIAGLERGGAEADLLGCHWVLE